MRRAFLLLLSAVAVACGGGGSRGTLAVELAPVAPGADECREEARSDSLPSARCATLRVCRPSPDGCVPVPLLRPGAGAPSRDVTFSELRFRDDPRLVFDLPSGEATEALTVELTVYDETGRPVAAGRTDGARFDRDDVRLRLVPYDRWACAGPKEGGGDVRSRALHAAVVLDGGEVLIFGGITGEGIPAAGRLGGAFLQPRVEVYDPVAARFHDVAVIDEVDGSDGFGRVLFAAHLVGVDGEGRSVVRVLGGYAADGGPALTFDATQAFNSAGLPFVPTGDTVLAPPVDLLYDAAARTLTVRAAEPQNVGAWPASSEPREGVLLVSPGLGVVRGEGGEAPVLGRYFFDDGGPGEPNRALPNPRVGHAAAFLPQSGTDFLVWGGLVTAPDADALVAGAGALVAPGMPVALPVSGEGLPEPGGLHTATTLGTESAGGVLLAGGERIDPPIGLSLQPAEPALTVIARVGTELERREVTGADAVAATIFHQATRRAGAGARLAEVVLTGGAVALDRGGVRSTLWPEGQAGRVSLRTDGVYLHEALPDLSVPRFGHAAVAIGGGAILVLGGLTRPADDELDATGVAELLRLDEPPPPLGPDACLDVPAFDAGPPPADAGPSDAGVDVGP